MSVCVCQGCGREFERKSHRGREPKWCSSRCRKRALYGGTCRVCGAVTNGYNGPGSASDVCAACYEPERKWTEDAIVAAIRRFAYRYGRQPHAPDFEPANARRMGHAWRAERFAADGDYPHVTTVLERFGTWNAAIKAAGFSPNGFGQYPHVPGERGGAHLADERTAA